MSRTLRVLAAYARRYWLQWSAGRSFMVTLVAQQAVSPLVGLAVWTAALPGRPDVSAYYVALLLVRLVTASYENHTFSNRIYSGELADDLLRPHPVVLAPLGENLAVRVWHLAIGLPVVAVAAAAVGVRPGWADLALALPALILAAALRFLFTYLLALTAFWTGRAHGAVDLGDTAIFLLGGGAAPVALLPEAVRPWVEALPFRAMNGFPAEVMAGGLNGSGVLAGYGWQAVWLAVLAGLVAATWRAGVRRYAAVGG